MSNSTTAQRRKGGGAPAKVVNTKVVHHDAAAAASNNNSATLAAAAGAADARMNNIAPGGGGGALLMVDEIIQKEQAVTHATVRRSFCGTGPFDKHWLNVDCCGLFCAFITYCLHAYGVYAVCFVLIPPWMSVIVNNNDITTEGASEQQQQHALSAERYLTTTGQLHRFVFITMALLACIAHFKAMTTDPGAVPPDAKPLPAETEQDTANNNDAQANDGSLSSPPPPRKPQHLRLCRRCRAYKPPRAHHCSVCKRCIIKMDHHCPWVNNCVGIGNHKYFLLFVFYTFITCLHSLILIVVRFSSCVHVHRRTVHNHLVSQHHHTAQVACLDQPTQLLTILGLLIESILFGMFTSCMMFDQQEVVHNKMTHIDRLKGLQIGGSLEGIAEVFGVRRPSSSQTNRLLRARRERRDSDVCIPVSTMSSPSSTNNTTTTVPAAKDQTRFRLDWLSPFVSACFPESVVDEVMGFCRPCRGGGGGGKNNNSGAMMEMMSSSKLAPGSKVVRSVTEIV